jgi:hypothetical protein
MKRGDIIMAGRLYYMVMRLKDENGFVEALRLTGRERGKIVALEDTSGGSVLTFEATFTPI